MIKKLFEPIKIGKVEIKNRIMMAPMDLAMAGQDGRVTKKIIDFYAERAKGGVGLITLGGASPSKDASPIPHTLAVYSDECVEPLQEFNRRMHEYGAKTSLQLLHPGRFAHPALNNGKQPVSSSAVPLNRIITSIVPHALTPEEIAETVELFARAACRAKTAGFDLVELHAGMGYLISQFISPAVNQREDLYGGSFDNRLRFPREIVGRIKALCGEDFPIVARIAGDEVMEEGYGLKECAAVAAAFEAMGAAAIALVAGWHESRTNLIIMGVPESPYRYMSREIKKTVNVPVAIGGRIRDLVIAEEILSTKQADLIMWGRPLIADPYLVNKLQEGREDDVTPCLSCNMCFDEMLSIKPVICAVNPLAGNEGIIISKAEKARKVMVVGAGPAGMMAALTAAERGHEVTLYEEKDELGGNLKLSYMPEGRGEIKKSLDHLTGRVKKSGIKVELGKKIEAEDILNLSPDSLVLAVGAEPIRPVIKGIEADNVFPAEEVLTGKNVPGEKVVIIGGGLIGCETALTLARRRAMSPETAAFLLRYDIINGSEAKEYLLKGSGEITIIEKMRKIGRGFGPSGRWVMLGELEMSGVKVMENSEVEEILPDGVMVKDKDGRKSRLSADTVILAVGYKSRNGLAQVKGKVPELLVIGDMQEPRKIGDAIRQGFEAGRKI